MRKQPAISAVLLFVGMVAILGVSNPELPEYQQAVLAPMVQDRQSASDAMVTTILQSISIAGSSRTDATPAPSLITVLTDRTQRVNYGMFSVYTTKFDECEWTMTGRTVGRSLGIAGKFYILDKGECRNQQNG